MGSHERLRARRAFYLLLPLFAGSGAFVVPAPNLQRQIKGAAGIPAHSLCWRASKTSRGIATGQVETVRDDFDDTKVYGELHRVGGSFYKGVRGRRSPHRSRARTARAHSSFAGQQHVRTCTAACIHSRPRTHPCAFFLKTLPDQYEATRSCGRGGNFPVSSCEAIDAFAGLLQVA